MYTQDAEEQIQNMMDAAHRDEITSAESRIDHLIALRNQATGEERERLNGMIDEMDDYLLDAEGY